MLLYKKEMNSLLLISLVYLVQGIYNETHYRFGSILHEAISSTNGKNVSLTIDENYAILEKLIENGAHDGADIIILPESNVGWLGWSGYTRATMYPWCEEVPDVGEKVCTDKWKNKVQLHRSACWAKDHKVYIVQSICDIDYCEKGSKSKYCGVEVDCPQEGYWNFNTAITFDREGRLVGKYHKTNEGDLFFQACPGSTRQHTDSGENAIFQADFDVWFAMFVCADIFNPFPAKDFYDKGIRNILYPLWDGPRVPFQSVFEQESGWSRYYKSNILISQEVVIAGLGVHSNGHLLFWDLIAPGSNETSKISVVDIPKIPYEFKQKIQTSTLKTDPILSLEQQKCTWQTSFSNIKWDNMDCIRVDVKNTGSTFSGNIVTSAFGTNFYCNGEFEFGPNDSQKDESRIYALTSLFVDQETKSTTKEVMGVCMLVYCPKFPICDLPCDDDPFCLYTPSQGINKVHMTVKVNDYFYSKCVNRNVFYGSTYGVPVDGDTYQIYDDEETLSSAIYSDYPHKKIMNVGFFFNGPNTNNCDPAVKTVEDKDINKYLPKEDDGDFGYLLYLLSLALMILL